MEAGNSTAGDGYKQDREHILSVYIKACKCLQVTGRIGYKYTDNRTDDHKNEQIPLGTRELNRLLQGKLNPPERGKGEATLMG